MKFDISYYVPQLCYVISSIPLNGVHLSYKSQIVSLITKETFTKMPDKYVDFVDIFALDLAFDFSEYIGINDHAIKLVNIQ